MRRQLAGVVAILTACVYLAGVAAIRDLEIGGYPRPMPGPLVGTCVGPVKTPQHRPSSKASTSSSSSEVRMDTETVATVVDCARPHDGRVISMSFPSDPHALAPVGEADDVDRCRSQLDTALSVQGFSPYVERAPGGSLSWRPAVTVSAWAVVLDDPAWSDGARWTACVEVTGGDLFGPGSAAPPPGVYLMVGVQDLTAIDYVGGVISTTPDALTNCTSPHLAQILALIEHTASSPAAADEQAACTAAAARFMGVSDPTAGGSLHIEVVQRPRPMCVAESIGDRAMNDSLLRIGTSGIPWVHR
jgi:hypothetical protein